MVIRSDPRRNDVSHGTPMTARWPWIAMLIALGLEFALGVVSLLLVPVGRPDGWLPRQGRAVYVVHAGLGGMLGIAALVIFAAAAHGGRIVRLGAQIGLVGLLLGASGGIAGGLPSLATYRYGTDARRHIRSLFWLCHSAP